MKKIGFIGAGNMAEALVKGLISSGINKRDKIIMSDIVEKRMEYMSTNYGVSTNRDNKKIIESSNIVILSVKPNNIEGVINEIKSRLSSKIIIISIAAGITTSFISNLIKKRIKLVRAMPNTPALVLEGATALYCNDLIKKEDKEEIKKIFESVGMALFVENENLLNAVTGLSGSGPAFVSMFIEALSDGGVKMGLSKSMSLNLAAQTVFGTAKLLKEERLHPAEIKDKVSSPGGTTIAGIHELEVKGFRGSVISAVEASAQRSIELSKGGK